MGVLRGGSWPLMLELDTELICESSALLSFLWPGLSFWKKLRRCFDSFSMVAG